MAKSSEQWKDIKGFPGYQVSSNGRIRNAETEKVLAPYKGALVVLSRKGTPTCRAVGRLVAEAFIGPVKKGTRVHRVDEKGGFGATNLRIGAAK